MPPQLAAAVETAAYAQGLSAARFISHVMAEHPLVREAVSRAMCVGESASPVPDFTGAATVDATVDADLPSGVAAGVFESPIRYTALPEYEESERREDSEELVLVHVQELGIDLGLGGNGKVKKPRGNPVWVRLQEIGVGLWGFNISPPTKGQALAIQKEMARLGWAKDWARLEDLATQFFRLNAEGRTNGCQSFPWSELLRALPALDASKYEGSAPSARRVARDRARSPTIERITPSRGKPPPDCA